MAPGQRPPAAAPAQKKTNDGQQETNARNKGDASTSGMQALPAEEPEDVLSIKNALKAMGVTEYEPGVLQLLLNYMYRCVSDVISDAEKYAQLAGQQQVSPEDVMLAVQSSQSQLQGQLPDQAQLKRYASEINEKPLPKPPSEAGMSVPQGKGSGMLQQNYRVMGSGAVQKNV